MLAMSGPTLLAASALALAVLLLWALRNRLLLSLAKHRSLAGHPRLARTFARLVPSYEHGEATFFDSDGAPPEIAAQRRQGFARLSSLYATRFARSTSLTREAAADISDLQFTSAYRVPFPYSRLVRERLASGSFMQHTSRVTVTDLDDNTFYDLAGSYGMNLFGYEFYKACIARGAEHVERLGPVLGFYHPLVVSNARRLCEISGQDEVSFHMSGTEAVMQAVRLARYHSGRRHVVCFCGAYHGWWGDVQPGVGNPLPARDTLTLRDMDDRSLRVLQRRNDIACVLVNPLQALHPNRAAPSDSALVDSTRHACFERAKYADWLRRLREVCTERGIALVFDEVFVGFRLARGGAQEYFGVRADMVTYGKTLAGGLPVGVLCGRASLMRRFREDRPADICFARGTFNSHPYVMGAMHEFLERLDRPAYAALYESLDEVWNRRARRANEAFADRGLPLRVANLSTIWTVCYTTPSRYNWMLQYYLRAEGLALSWIGTGRLIFSADYTDAEFDAVLERMVAAACRMRDDGWWWHPPGATNRTIRRRLLAEMLSHRLRPASGAGMAGAHAASGASRRAHGIEQFPAQ
jgi:glutamate-1-semialdehyde 2,1-aminomutase